MSDFGKIAASIAEDFYKGRFDLSARDKISAAASWSLMPHVECVQFLRDAGTPERTILFFITFLGALDRAKDSERLWWNGLELHEAHPEIFDPLALLNVSVDELGEYLEESGVSRNTGQDSEAWLRIAQTITFESNCPVSRVIYGKSVDVKKLIKDLGTRAEDGSNRFPLLSGPKTSSVWLRMLASPGGANITHLDTLPVSVDQQVSRATINLGLVKSDKLSSTPEAQYIQSVWRSALATVDFEAPEGVRNTCAGLDPALSFFSKFGCGHCDKQGTPVRIGLACNHCRLFR